MEEETMELAFVAWQGGCYEAFESIEEADHEIMAMAGRHLKGWSTTDFQDILDDAAQPHKAVFAPKNTDEDEAECWELFVDTDPVGCAILTVVNNDFKAMRWSVREQVGDSGFYTESLPVAIDLAELRKHVEAAVVPNATVREALQTVAEILECGGPSHLIGAKLMSQKAMIFKALGKNEPTAN